LAIFGGGERQAGRAAKEIALLGRELALETVGLDDLLTLAHMQGAQVPDSGL